MAQKFYASDYVSDIVIKKVFELYDSLVSDIGVKRGDLMQLTKKEYRDDTPAIFDGKKFIDLADEPDDYGTIPREFFIIDEFPINHFKEKLAHNNLVPFNHKNYMDLLKDNLEYSNSDLKDIDKMK